MCMLEEISPSRRANMTAHFLYQHGRIAGNLVQKSQRPSRSLRDFVVVATRCAPRQKPWQAEAAHLILDRFGGPCGRFKMLHYMMSSEGHASRRPGRQISRMCCRNASAVTTSELAGISAIFVFLYSLEGRSQDQYKRFLGAHLLVQFNSIITATQYVESFSASTPPYT
jgi:hypothetical protein